MSTPNREQDTGCTQESLDAASELYAEDFCVIEWSDEEQAYIVGE